jgi:acid phosphatase
MMENHSYADIVGSRSAPYLNSLAATGALFTKSFAVSHPSEPNYLALFSGSTHGLRTDACPLSFHGRSLASELRARHDTFVGYSEGLPSTGYMGCSSGSYARKHNPWSDFGALPKNVNQPFSRLPKHFRSLPTVSFIVPNLQHDMHDGTIAEADRWAHHKLAHYVRAARHHHGLVIITWDEDDYSQSNQIPTIIVGQDVKPGRYHHRIDHYGLLRTLEAAYHLRPLGQSARRRPVTKIWQH